MYKVEKCLQDTNEKYNEQLLKVTPTRLELVVEEGNQVEAEVSVSSLSGMPLHYFFYSEDYRMQCLSNVETGASASLTVRFDATGLEGGQKQEGELCILSEGGEYRIPYSVTVQMPFAQSPLGTIRNLFHFTNLARDNWQQALALFYSDSMEAVFTGHDRQYYSLYRGLSGRKGNESNMDEFLNAIHKKTPIQYQFGEDSIILIDPPRDQKQELVIEKSGWGHVALSLSADHDCICFEKTEITEADFEKNRCHLYFYVDMERVSGDDETCQITARSKSGLIDCKIVLHRPALLRKKQVLKKEQKVLVLSLTKCYLEYGTGSAKPEVCLKEAEKIVEQMNSQYGRNIAARLYQAHILFLMQRENEMRWVLSHVENMLEREEVSADLYAYYLYLEAVLSHDSGREKQVCGEIHRLLENGGDAGRLTCLYMRLAKDHITPIKKMSMYEAAFQEGANSPLLYLEAFHVLEQSPAYLTKLEDFEVAVLRFAMKYGLYTEEMSHQVNALVMRKKTLKDSLFALLCQSYQIFPMDETLQAFCTLLIRNGKADAVCFPWYSLAVERNLRITSLYEYYMMSQDAQNTQLPPKMILMYFTYQCQLEDKKKAQFYRNLILNQDKIGNLWDSYRPQIEQFAWKMLEKGQKSENLAGIYRFVFETREQIEKAGRGLLQMAFSHQISTGDKDARRIVLIEDQLEREAVYDLIDGQATINCFTDSYTLLLEDEAGNRYQDAFMSDQKLMARDKIAMALLGSEEEEIGYLLFQLSCMEQEQIYEKHNFPLLKKLAMSDDTEKNFRMELLHGLMQASFEAEDSELLKQLLEDYPLDKADQQKRAEIIQYLIYLQEDEMASKILFDYGFEEVSDKAKSRLLARNITENSGYEPKWMALAIDTFAKGKYTQEMLQYLNLYFEGSTRSMKKLWKAAVDFDIDASCIAEKVLIASMLGDTFVSGIEEVFAYYVSHQKRESVVYRFLNQAAYDAFVKEKIIPEKIYAIMESYLMQEMAVDPICKIAYLQYVAAQPDKLGQQQRQLVRSLTLEFIRHKQYVPFFESFLPFMPELLCYTERTYLEYRTNPAVEVYLHSSLSEKQEGYQKQKLTPIYPGYYCESFVLYFGQHLQYYFLEKFEANEQLTESGNLEKADYTDALSGSRFAMINDIVMSETLGDMQSVDKLKEKYLRRAYMVDTLF